MQPLVSIIIPCWNAEAYVGEALDSALGQTLPNVEVIVIDDGSTDGSLEVIKSYGKRVRWETGANRGACAARNRGLALATGELIQFLDADDILFPGKLERMVPLAVVGGGGVMPVCDWERRGLGPSSPIEQHPLGDLGDDSFLFCLEHQLQTSSPLHRRLRLIAVGGFDETLPCSQERDLHLRLTAAGLGMVGVAEPLFRVRRRAQSLSADYVKVLDQHRLIFLKALDVLRAEHRLTEQRQRAVAAAIARDARRYVRHGLLGRARDYFALAERLHPSSGPDAFGRWYSRLLARAVGGTNAERLLLSGGRLLQR